jgi:hypothetical protein
VPSISALDNAISSFGNDPDNWDSSVATDIIMIANSISSLTNNLAVKSPNTIQTILNNTSSTPTGIQTAKNEIDSLNLSAAISHLSAAVTAADGVVQAKVAELAAATGTGGSGGDGQSNTGSTSSQDKGQDGTKGSDSNNDTGVNTSRGGDGGRGGGGQRYDVVPDTYTPGDAGAAEQCPPILPTDRKSGYLYNPINYPKTGFIFILRNY